MNEYEDYIIGDGCLIAPNSDVIILDLSESLKKYIDYTIAEEGYLIGPNGELINPNGNPVENEDDGYEYEDYDLPLKGYSFSDLQEYQVNELNKDSFIKSDEYAFSDIQEYEIKKENNCFDFFETIENIFKFFLIKND